MLAPSKHLTMCGWDNAPHLDEKTKAELLEATPPHLRKARSEGIPSLGSGAIYPVEEDVFKIDPFHLPAYWPRAYAMDVGWNRTAALWLAHDREEDVAYLYAEHYRGKAEPSIHATAIKARGAWIPGAIDPAANGASQKDGQQLSAIYRALGLTITNADNGVEAGINDVWERLSTGRLKVFSTLRNWFVEYRLYRRDEHGRVVKQNDHLMDCTRYVIRSGIRIAITQPIKRVSNDAIVADNRVGY